MKLIVLDAAHQELADYDLADTAFILDEQGFTFKEPLTITVKKAGTIDRVLLYGRKVMTQLDTDIINTDVRPGDSIHFT